MPIIFYFLVFLVMSSINLFADNNLVDEYKIGPGDVVGVQVWDNSDLDRDVSVAQDGSFTFPLIGKVYGGGLTAYELEVLVKEKLADGYLVDPQVSVKVRSFQSQKVFLFGEVRKAGSYYLKKKTHLLELISMAGGFTGDAGQTVTIVRNKHKRLGKGAFAVSENKKPEIITLDLAEYDPKSRYDIFYLVNGDSIYVEKVQRYFVMGEVRRPGRYAWEEGLTVRHAISLAGGPNESAAIKRTKFIRVNRNGKEEEINANMEDFVMYDDIIVVSERYF